MKRNLAQWDRVLRVVFALTAVAGIAFAPVPLLVRVLACGGTAAYLLFTALSGTCLGYRLIGASTCPTNLSR